MSHISYHASIARRDDLIREAREIRRHRSSSADAGQPTRTSSVRSIRRLSTQLLRVRAA